MCRLLPGVGAGPRLAGVTSLRDMRVWELHQAGHSIRAVARQVGLSRSQVHRIISDPAPDMSPIAYLGPEDDDDELPLALLAHAATEREPSEALTPPFDFEGLVNVPDSMPTRRRDNKIRLSPQWRDAHGHPLDELDLYRWGQWLHNIIPANYATKDEYLAAWDAADKEIQAVKRHAWDSLHAAGVRVLRPRPPSVAQAPASGLGP